MKARHYILVAVALLALHTHAMAGDLSAGIFNSPRGFGISLDYYATEDIYNTYIVYADMYGIYSGTYRNSGVKFIYLHYNRLGGIDTDYAAYGLFLGPGASTGYVRDFDSEKFGFTLTADIALALRAQFPKNFDLELAMMVEMGFIARDFEGKTQLDIYGNGLRQVFLPTLKIMYRF